MSFKLFKKHPCSHYEAKKGIVLGPSSYKNSMKEVLVEMKLI